MFINFVFLKINLIKIKKNESIIGLYNFNQNTSKSI